MVEYPEKIISAFSLLSYILSLIIIIKKKLSTKSDTFYQIRHLNKYKNTDMKNLLKLLGMVIIAAIVMVSCESDPGTGGGDPIMPPNISATSSATILTPAETFTVSVNATAGDAEMNTFTVLENGVQLDPSRITEIVGLSAVNNPALLFEGDRASFTYDVSIIATTQVGDHTYSFTVDDENNRSASADIFITVEASPATINYDGSMSITDVLPGNLVSLNLDVSQGTFPMSSIAVYEDGVLIDDASRLELAGVAFDANPNLLTEDQKAGFSEMLLIRVHETAGTKSYTVEIADDGGQLSTLSLDITAGTSLTELQGVLFNAGGGQGTGGLDLDEGISTNSDDASAEIKDLGIDTDLPLDQNWIQRITAINGFEARYLFAGQSGLPETFTFDGISFKEQIPSLWENSTPFTSEDVNTGEKVSFIMEVDDVFIVSDGVKYYTFIVREVNLREMDNSDNYVLDIKY